MSFFEASSEANADLGNKGHDAIRVDFDAPVNPVALRAFLSKQNPRDPGIAQKLAGFFSNQRQNPFADAGDLEQDL